MLANALSIPPDAFSIPPDVLIVGVGPARAWTSLDSTSYSIHKFKLTTLGLDADLIFTSTRLIVSDTVETRRTTRLTVSDTVETRRITRLIVSDTVETRRIITRLKGFRFPSR